MDFSETIFTLVRIRIAVKVLKFWGIIQEQANHVRTDKRLETEDISLFQSVPWCEHGEAVREGRAVSPQLRLLLQGLEHRPPGRPQVQGRQVQCHL